MSSAPRQSDDPGLRDQARMAADSCQTLELPGWAARLRVEDESARKELRDCACRRLNQLAGKMLKGPPGEPPGDQMERAVEDAIVHLYQALSEARPAGARELFGFAALNIRRALVDLARQCADLQGSRANYATLGNEPGGAALPPEGPEQPETGGRGRPGAWIEFHSQVERLPEEDRELYDLLWYLDLAPAEAAPLLNVSSEVLRRRWQSARLKLHQALQGRLPEP
jgi:DNA-directed RNA polymerase specialized sigma24 family protein